MKKGMQRKFFVTCDTIIAYLPFDFDGSTAFDGDELYEGLRSDQIYREERIKTTHDAVYDFVRPLIEDPLKGLACVNGGHKYLKCHHVIVNNCGGVSETRDLTAIKNGARRRIPRHCCYARVDSLGDNTSCTLRQVRYALHVLLSADRIAPMPSQ